MIPITHRRGETIAVFGLGGSGLATCKALLEGGARVAAFDDDPNSVAAAAGEGIPTEDLRHADWSHFGALVLSPGVPLTHPKPHWSVGLAQRAGKPIIGDIELYCRQRLLDAPDAPLIAVTGTNGKSTTTALITHILRHAGHDVEMGGNIGTPILALSPPARDRFHVIEVSSFQIELAPSLAPTVGVLLNLSEDHLDRHGTMENYAAIKERLVQAARLAVIGTDDPLCKAIARRAAAARAGGPDELKAIEFSGWRVVNGGYGIDDGEIGIAAGADWRGIARLDDIATLRGQHNAQNAAAAIAAVDGLAVRSAVASKGQTLPRLPRIGFDVLQQALRTFPGLPHRMEEVGRRGRVLFVNDSKATNADSAARALACFEDIYWIAGGQPKTGGIVSLAEFFPRIRKAYLIGDAAQAFAATLDGEVAHEIAGTLDKAVAQAARDAAAAGGQPVVLLSPACASFDQFRNFGARGDAFRELVKALPA